MIDAGHMSVESKLVDRKSTRGILGKRSQPYSAKDFEHLESLMYDRFILKLEDAQVKYRVIEAILSLIPSPDLYRRRAKQFCAARPVEQRSLPSRADLYRSCY